ncbi:MAG TPA: hypothetical protein PKI89_12755 [Tepidiformaceae bacterium]|nr:hypothetical protein [Tepidiformaceae bacterium]
MDAGKGTYRVVVWDQDEYLKEYMALPPNQQARVADLYNNHLPYRPAEMKPPWLKRLKGTQSHLRQFDCGGGKRLHYVIDEEAKEVRIVGLGKHLEWDKKNKVGG